MLPEISLDNTGFEDIVKKARSQISEIYPAWTDYNYHDPGITILEMFAFLKEAQQFYIDQISDDMRRKFLYIMGITLKKRQASKTIIRLLTEESVVIPIGTKFYINNLCYETKSVESVPGSIIDALIVKPVYGNIYKLKVSQAKGQGSMVVYPFGKNTGAGSEFYICLSKKLIKGKKYSISILLDENYGVKRNEIIDSKNFIPLSKIKITYFNGSKDVEINALDDTLGMIRSGKITFSINDDMAYSVKEGIEGYFIKFSLEEDNLDVSPAIKDIGFNDVVLVQKDTKAVFLEKEKAVFWKKNNTKADYYIWNENNGCYIDTTPDKAEYIAIYEYEFYKNRILAVGNGLPDQKYDLPLKGILSEYFEILVSSVKDKGFMRKWQKVENFDNSGPDDSHYVIDEENSCIYFGNGIHGRMPEDEIRIISCAFSQGSKGNIKAGQRVECDSLPGFNYGYSICDSKGGSESEKIDEGFLRAREMIKNDDRAVSENDYERLVMQTPGLRIWDCKVLDNDSFNDECYQNEVRIAVRPYSENGYAVLSKAYEKNILNYIMEKRLIGTFIRLYSPVYIEVGVYMELRIKSQYINAENKVENIVRKFFAELKGFGPVINYGELFACIDSIEEVSEVYMLYIDARGARISRNRNGDVILPPLGVLLLKKVDCIVIQ